MFDIIRVNEVVVYILRETGWTLEYIRSLSLDILNELVNELSYQKAMDDYKQAYNSAVIVSALVSTKQHRVTPQEIVGEPPQRKSKIKESDIWELAKGKGIKIPVELI